MNDKRSDFPCPGIISSGSYSKSQARDTRAIQSGVEAKIARRDSSAAHAQHRRNEDYLAARRRDPRKSIRRPT